MYVKTVEYEDYDGNKRKEDLYFHLNEAELFETQVSTIGGFEELVQRIIKTRNTPELMRVFKELLHKSYGVKSPDGKRFIKNDEVWDEFIQSEAYSVFFMQLLGDDIEAANFINGVIPKKLRDQIKDEDIEANKKKLAEELGIDVAESDASANAISTYKEEVKEQK